MLVVTTSSIDGKRITQYLGLVSGDAGGMLMVSANGTAVVVQ